MKALGACCTWATFWTDGFVRHWQAKLPGVPIPAYIEKKARHYWRVYAMTGWEAWETIRRHEDLDLLFGGASNVPRPEGT